MVVYHRARVAWPGAQCTRCRVPPLGPCKRSKWASGGRCTAPFHTGSLSPSFFAFSPIFLSSGDSGRPLCVLCCTLCGSRLEGDQSCCGPREGVVMGGKSSGFFFFPSHKNQVRIRSGKKGNRSRVQRAVLAVVVLFTCQRYFLSGYFPMLPSLKTWSRLGGTSKHPNCAAA